MHVINSADPAGGGPIEGVKQRGIVLEQMGHTVEVVSLDQRTPETEKWMAEFPLKLYALGPKQGKFGYSAHLVPWLMQNAANYDGVVVNGLWQYHGYAVHKAMTQLKRPYVVFTHGMLDPWFKQTYPLKHLKKMLYWRMGEYRVLRDAAAVLFTCEEEKILARQSFSPYKVNERVVSYGSPGPSKPIGDLQKIFLDAFPNLQNKRIILFLGRIHPKKGCDLLIEAFAKVAHQNDLRLVIAGPDQTGWQSQLQARAQTLGIADQITWAGMITGDLKWGAFGAAEAFILPSHQENFGISVAEALSCGTPVLISNKVNIWREIESDGAGLVQPDTLEGTVQLLETWMGLDDAQKAEMKIKALTCFRSKFEIHAAATSLVDLLDDCSDVKLVADPIQMEKNS